eukprot:gene15152-21218_t
MLQVIKHYGILEEADYLHCMAYDSRGKHSTIQFAKTGIELAQSTFGEDAAKFTLGVPFYGRNTNTMEAHNFYDLMPLIRNNKDNEAHNFYDLMPLIRNNKDNEAQNFYDLMPLIRNNKDNEAHNFYELMPLIRNNKDNEAQNFFDLMPLIRNNKDNEVNGVFYNSQKTLKKKTELAIAGGLGGVMIWELGQDVQPFDKPQSLMHGIYNAVSKTAKAVTTAGAKEEL